MKYFGLIVAFCLALSFSACGGTDSTAESPDESSEESRIIKPFEPEIDPPKPLPKKLVVNDLKEGSGPAAELGDELLVDYYSVNEKDKKRFASTTAGFKFKLGGGDYWPGWEKGLEGIKAGGEREILMPPQFTANLGYLFYIVHVREIEKPPAAPADKAES